MAKKQKVYKPSANKQRQPKGNETSAKPPAAKTSDANIESGSDCGNFLDDDTEDFIPNYWQQLREAKPENHEEERIIATETVTPSISKSQTMTKTEANTIATKTVTASAIRSQISEEPEDNIPMSSIFFQTRATTTNQETITVTTENNVRFPVDTPQVSSKVTKTTTSRVIIPERKIQQPQSALEKAQDEIAALKKDVEKQQRDLKSAKKQAGDSRAELDILKSKDSEELEKVRRELNAQHALHYNELKCEMKGLEEERDKATADLRKLRENYEKVKRENKAIQQKLDAERETVQWLERDNESLQSQKSNLALRVGLYKQEKESADKERKRLGALLTAETRKTTELSRQVKDLESESSNLREQIGKTDSEAAEAVNLQHEYNDLSRKYDSLTDDLSLSNNKLGDLERKFLQQRQELTSLKTTLEKSEKDLMASKSLVQKRNKKVNGLEKKVKDLENERDVCAPILEKSVDIGLRFLEQARQEFFGLTRSQVDRLIIVDGNNAAHQGNGKFHAALFKGGFVSDDYMDAALEIYEKLYDITPFEYGSLTPRHHRLIDCEATLLTLRAINNGDRSVELREEHNNLIHNIMEKYDEMEDDDFEEDSDVEGMLERLERLTEQIVEVDRYKGRR